MMFFIPRLIRLAVSIGRMCMTQVHSRPYSITISQQSLDLSRFSSLSRPICLCQSIQTVLSYIFHPNRSFFHPYQTSSHLHDHIHTHRMITSSRRHQKNVFIPDRTAPFSSALIPEKPRNIKLFHLIAVVCPSSTPSVLSGINRILTVTNTILKSSMILG